MAKRKTTKRERVKYPGGLPAYKDTCGSEGQRLYLVRKLVEQLHSMGLDYLVPVALIPHDEEDRIVGEKGYVPFYRLEGCES